MCVCVAGLLSDWYQNLDALKESCRIASSYNWADVDLSPFQGAVWTLPIYLAATVAIDDFPHHFIHCSNLKIFQDSSFLCQLYLCVPMRSEGANISSYRLMVTALLQLLIEC